MMDISLKYCGFPFNQLVIIWWRIFECKRLLTPKLEKKHLKYHFKSNQLIIRWNDFNKPDLFWLWKCMTPIWTISHIIVIKYYFHIIYCRKISIFLAYNYSVQLIFNAYFFKNPEYIKYLHKMWIMCFIAMFN